MQALDINSAAASASRPTRFTLRMRTFLPYQLLRFVMINIRMLRMLARCHGGPSK